MKHTEENTPLDQVENLSENEERQLQALFDSTTSASAQAEARMAAAAERIPEQESKREEASKSGRRHAHAKVTQLPGPWWTRPQNIVALAAAAAAVAFLLNFGDSQAPTQSPDAPSIVADNTASPPPSPSERSPEEFDDEDSDGDDRYLSSLGVDSWEIDPWAGIDLLDGPDNDADSSSWEAGYEAAMEDG